MKSNFIYHKKRGLSDKLCNSIIDFFEINPNKSKGCVYSNSNTLDIDTSAKNSTDLTVDFNKMNDSCLFEMHHHLCEQIKTYKKKFSFLNELSNWKLDEKFNIIRYNPQEAFYALHCEHGPGICSTRIMAWMIYLNNVKNSGETYFPYQRKRFKPRQGDILIWPAFWTHPHQGIPSKTEIKYIATGWISFSQ